MCPRSVTSGRVAGAIRTLVNVKGLQPECGRVSHESMLMLVPMCVSETMI